MLDPRRQRSASFAAAFLVVAAVGGCAAEVDTAQRRAPPTPARQQDDAPAEPNGAAAADEPRSPPPYPNCAGYTEILGPATNRIFRGYPPNVVAACEAAKASCAEDATSTRKILCAAFEYDGVFYGNAYSDTYGGDKAIPIYGFAASSDNYGLRPTRWLADRTTGLDPNNLLECSGLTAVALYRAFGFASEDLYCSGQFTNRANPTLFDQVSAKDIRAGDFLTKTFGCNSAGGAGGHVAIAVTTPDASGELVVYETNAWKKPVRFAVKSLSYFAGGWSRFKAQ